jgi:uncharacterized integral membrane protein
MQILIILVLFGILASVFAIQNTTNVSIILLGYPLREVPIYLIVSGSLLIGLLLSSVVSIVNSIFNSFKMHGKNVKIKESKKTVEDLAKRNRELELEITKLRERTRIIDEKD